MVLGCTGLMDLMILKVTSNFDNPKILTYNNNSNFSNCSGEKTQLVICTKESGFMPFFMPSTIILKLPETETEEII